MRKSSLFGLLTFTVALLFTLSFGTAGFSAVESDVDTVEVTVSAQRIAQLNFLEDSIEVDVTDVGPEDDPQAFEDEVGWSLMANFEEVEVEFESEDDAFDGIDSELIGVFSYQIVGQDTNDDDAVIAEFGPTDSSGFITQAGSNAEFDLGSLDRGVTESRLRLLIELDEEDEWWELDANVDGYEDTVTATISAAD